MQRNRLIHRSKISHWPIELIYFDFELLLHSSHWWQRNRRALESRHVKQPQARVCSLGLKHPRLAFQRWTPIFVRWCVVPGCSFSFCCHCRQACHPRVETDTSSHRLPSSRADSFHNPNTQNGQSWNSALSCCQVTDADFVSCGFAATPTRTPGSVVRSVKALICPLQIWANVKHLASVSLMFIQCGAST